MGSFSSTAMMSARGTITSSTWSVPKRRMRSSISRSSAEKASASPALLSAFSSVARSVGAPGRPSFARSPVNQLWVGSPDSDCFVLITSSPAIGGSIRIGDPQRRQDLDLEPFHDLGLRRRLVVEAQEMQEAVNDKVLQMMHGRDVLLAGLVADGLDREHDIAEMRRRNRPVLEGEREQVRRPI